MTAGAASSPPDFSQRWLWAIVAVAAALRIFPLWFGLPYLNARPDEGTAVGHAMAIVQGDLNPHFFHWPSLTFYLFAAVFRAASSVRGLLDGDPTLTAAEQILIGRGLVALAGTLTIVVIFRIGRRSVDAATGLVAAALLSVALLHVRDSHFAMTDILMTLLLTVSLAVLLWALDRALAAPSIEAVSYRDFAVAGLVGGLATSTKYSAAAVVAAMAAAQVLLLVHFRRMPWSPQTWSPSLAFAAAMLAGFVVGTPYAVLDFETFSADLRFVFAQLSESHYINLGRGWIYHLTHSLPYGAGIPTFAASILGGVWMARAHPRPAFVIGAFAVAFYASIGSGHTVFFRYVLPLIPVSCLFAAVAVRRAAPWAAARTGLTNRGAIVMLTALIAGPSLVNSVWFDIVLTRTDTRVLAADWLAPRVRASETLHDTGGTYATLDLGLTAYQVWSHDPKSDFFDYLKGRAPDWLVLHSSPLRTHGRHAASLGMLAAEQYDLVWEIRGAGGGRSAVYDLQDAFFMPVSGFHRVARPGPSIRIYRRR